MKRSKKRSALNLSRRAIDKALPRVVKGLTQYLWLQSELHKTDVSGDREFQRRFNHFYRVRRGAAWQRAFFPLLERSKTRRNSFAAILRTLHQATGRWEASFASKLHATVNARSAVIDYIVLKNTGLKLPSIDGDRSKAIGKLRSELHRGLTDFLRRPNGKYLVRRFRALYPQARISDIKKLDFVLWQSR